MPNVEYRVVPAPKRGKKARGLRGADERFAHALELAINEMAAEGWEFVRTDALPVEERAGLTARVTTFQHLLIFCRPVAYEAVAEEPTPRAALPAPAEPVESDFEDEPEVREDAEFETEEADESARDETDESETDNTDDPEKPGKLAAE